MSLPAVAGIFHLSVIAMRCRVLFYCIALLPVVCGAGPMIKLQSAMFDPVAGARTMAVEAASERDSGGSGYYILQFSGPILDEWKTGATAAGAELLDYLPDFAFIIRAQKSSESQLRALPYVRWLGDYAPSYRVSNRVSTDKDSDVVIRLFPGADNAALRKRVSDAGGGVDDEGPTHFRAHVRANTASQIARAAGVAWIEPKPHYRLSNDIARGIMGETSLWQGIGLYGAGQTVAVADTGLDTGNQSTLSLDFKGRVVKTYALGTGRTNDWSDSLLVNGVPYGGHGTHTTGSVLGGGALSGSTASSHSYVGSFAGIAPEASLVFQSVMDSSGGLGGIPPNLSNLFTPVYTDGARVHSDSWGDNANAAQYTSDSYNTDNFLWGHKDMVICLAAGNDGTDTSPADGFVDSGSVESPSTAKNCISVGASESMTSAGYQGTYGIQSWGLTTAPIAADTMSNNSSGMAGFSSRGPTADGRIKPDICAPGTNIISCRSHMSGTETLWGVYNNDYLYSGGTSMSTPLVAGSCALVREYYIKNRGISVPSAALVKATLINGAFDMTPGQYPVPPGPREIAPRPNSVEGWGRVDLKSSILPASPKYSYATDNNTGLSTNGSVNYTYYVASSSAPLKVTLAWTDYRGTTGAATELVNDLDLKVTAPGGTVYYGNGGASADRKNNVEGVDIAAPATGLYTINVRAYNIPHGPQPYALVASGPLTATQPTQVSLLSGAQALADGTLVQLVGKSVSAGSDAFLSAFYIEENDRSSGIRVQYGVGGGPTVHDGDIVTVVGTLATVNGERQIQSPIVN